ncbi:hypothetical protein P7K49_017336 [Saguinus oedipus]|uniref:Uncharacterized protein n=1 Tax=Saguinus oedipus TaxID=9490 RepID=A0ABQ9V2X4_SAGOE|nr:hypothetical protein P7K49_017336 [Saguinus oedipus]
MNGLICLPGSRIASLTGQQDQCILYGKPLRCGSGQNSALVKTAALAKTAVLAKTATLVTHGAPPPGNLLVCGQKRPIWKYDVQSPSVLSLIAAILSCS